jgi:hypothetical protein
MIVWLHWNGQAVCTIARISVHVNVRNQYIIMIVISRQ